MELGYLHWEMIFAFIQLQQKQGKADGQNMVLILTDYLMGSTGSTAMDIM